MEFLETIKNPFDAFAVRTKINNERKKFMDSKNKRLNVLGLADT